MTTDEMRIDLLRTTFRYGRVNMGIRLGNITHGEFTALQMVHIYMKRNPDASGIGVSELARCSFMSPPAMSRTLKSIEEKGLAERMIDSKNRRKTYVRLTQAGEQARQYAWEVSTEYINRVMEEMGEESPTIMIKECRLHVAKDLLLKTKKTIDEIVFEAGFSNKVTFFKVFLEKYGCTPKEFRTKHLEEVQ